MPSSLVLIALLLFSAALANDSLDLCAPIDSPTTNTISYQIHSWDDLREWPQALQKGATWFKIDTHWVDAPFCTGQSNVINPRPEGCFLLSHDTPVSSRTNYNTSLDILNILSSQTLAPYFTNEEKKVYIALCFKTDSFDPCDGSVKATNWTRLVDQLFVEYNAFVEQTGVQVEFILDGAATAGGNRTCLANKWRPWNMTWIITTDPLHAFVSNSPSLGYDRFQIMNTPINEHFGITINLNHEAEYDYGKFLKSTYPFLNWEPSDQYEILLTEDAYIKKGLIHDPGFLFAINIDIVQFEVFSGSRSGTAWNKCLGTFGSHPVSTLLSSPTDSTQTILFFYHSSISGSAFSYQFLYFTEEFGDVQISAQNTLSTPADNSDRIVEVSSVRMSEQEVIVFVWYESGFYRFFQVDQSTTSLDLLNQGSIENSSTVTTSVLTKLDFNGTLTVISSGSSPDCAALFWQTYTVYANWTLGNSFSICVPTFSTIEVKTVGLGVINTQSAFSSPCTTNPALAGIISFSDANYNLYYQMFCLDSSSVSFVGYNAKPLDVGEFSKISLAYQSDVLVVMEVHDRGFCWNTHTNNIQATPAVCDATPVSSEEILNYNFGSLLGWKQHLLNQQYLSACSEHVLHGTFDTGYHPSVSLFTLSGKLGIAEIHKGTEVDQRDAHQCGDSLPTASLILDGWNLPILSSTFIPTS